MMMMMINLHTMVCFIIIILFREKKIKKNCSNFISKNRFLLITVSPVGLTPSPQISHASNRVPSQQYSNRLDGGVHTPPGPSRVPVPIAAGVSGGQGQCNLLFGFCFGFEK